MERDVTAKKTEENWTKYYSSLASDDSPDMFAEEYGKYVGTHTWRNSVRVISEHSNFLPLSEVLDAGCGWGGYLDPGRTLSNEWGRFEFQQDYSKLQGPIPKSRPQEQGFKQKARNKERQGLFKRKKTIGILQSCSLRQDERRPAGDARVLGKLGAGAPCRCSPRRGGSRPDGSTPTSSRRAPT